MKIDTIVVEVRLLDGEKELKRAECFIPITPGEPLRAGKLMDACQRSVAHCLDELQKELDFS
ncbi:MAG: hypothetical protein KAJ19_25565 [Gammaproteobacteria bacterium]|nr:hypothetical protein [Gammaproteobacteria bacterium]